jgi:hypothetical protein
MKLESLINFRVGDRVIFNPDNHGYKFLVAYGKVKYREGTVRFIEERREVLCGGRFEFVRTGRITVEWDGTYETKIVHYSRLMIIKSVADR